MLYVPSSFSMLLPNDISLCTIRIRRFVLLSNGSLSRFHLQIKQLCRVLASCEPGEMVQLRGGSGYCICAETAESRCSTRGPPNFVSVSVWVVCQPGDTQAWLCVTRIALLIAGWYKCWTSDCPCRVYFCVVLGGSEFNSWLSYCFSLLSFTVLLSRKITCNNSTCN